MPEGQFSIAVNYRNTATSDVKVYLTLSGPFQRPLSGSALNEIEQAAYNTPSAIVTSDSSVEFIVSLPDSWNLSLGEAERIDAALFRGLITRGRKGNWSKLDKYPPSKDYPD